MSTDTGNILIVDDDADVLLAAEIVLKKRFRTVLTESDPLRLPRHLVQHNFDVVLLDMNFTAGLTSGREGLEWLKKIRELAPDAKVIMMTAYGAIELAVKAIKEGASDFVIKPWDNSKLLATVAAAVRYSQTDREVKNLQTKQKMLNRFIGGEPGRIIGDSEALRDVLTSIEKVARTDANVLILGENGTGKELIAREIHRQSLRSDQAFINVDLGAISESLFESELFGHRKGAFTDAKEDRAGRFEIASGGTLFLDEIGNLNVQMQAKLLGALESRTISRVGSDIPIHIDIRLICATNMSLNRMQDRNQFRQDLLYRINTVEIHVPPLRERLSDIDPLARHFVNLYSRKYNKPGLDILPDTFNKLRKYHWPGNIREFQHTMERAVIMTENTALQPDDFILAKQERQQEAMISLNLGDLEKQAIQKAVSKHQGNLSKAAQELGLGRTTLYRKIAKHGI
jgi:DNA-binding NtrC family response regulator